MILYLVCVSFQIIYYIIVHDISALEFVVEPPVGTIHLNQMQNITFQCRVNSIGHSDKPMWTLHYPDTDQFLSTQDDNDKDIIEEHGIHYYSGETVANITIPGTVENNRTQVWCTTLHSGVTEFSDSIEIIIAGKLLHSKIKGYLDDPVNNLVSNGFTHVNAYNKYCSRKVIHG